VTSKDGRVLARENELRVLRALHRFGWLRTRDLAVLVWQRWAAKPSSDGPNLRRLLPTAAGLRMAQRTLRRLRDARQVLSSLAPDGSTLYALAEAGARCLQSIGVAATSGKDLLRQFSSSHFRHRCIANEIAIAAIVGGFRASTDRETAQGHWLGGASGIAGKRPDALLRSSELMWWVEVERSRKNAKDYAKLLAWLDEVLLDATQASGPQLLGKNLFLAKVVFICTPAFRNKLLKELSAIGWQKKILAELFVFETSLYTFMDINFS